MHALVPHLAIAVPLQHERSTLLVSSDDVSSRALTPFAFARVHVDGRRAAATRPHSHLVARSGPLIVLLGHEDSGPLRRMSCR